MNGHTLLGCAFACLILSPTWLMDAYGDTWGPPKRVHPSENGTWSLVLGLHGGKTLSLCENTDEGLTEHWQRGYVHNIWSPHLAYVTNDGKYVVLRDTYHNIGLGKVIVILGEGGKVLGSYELGDLLPQDEILRARRTVSSLWWTDNAWFSFLENQRQFALITQNGTLRCFDLPTGKLLELTADQRATIVATMLPQLNAWIESEKPSLRIRAIRLLGGLGTEDAIPTVKRLFHDLTPTDSIDHSDRPNAQIFGVQKAAALALTELLGAAAIPIIEQELIQANGYMQKQLLEILAGVDTKGFIIVETPNTAALSEMWKRLASNPNDNIRYPALCEVLYRDDGSYLLDHPVLIESENEAVRQAAVHRIKVIDSPQAKLMLRTAITDDRALIRQSALRQLVQREPADIQETLLQYLQDESISIRTYVTCELVSLGNPIAMAKLQETIASWQTLDLVGDDTWVQRNEIETLCRLVAELQVHQAKASLVGVRSLDAPQVPVFINGALAALGDDQALEELHRIATDGKPSYDHVLAISMCRYQSDPKSAAIVNDAAKSKHRDLRNAATKDLPQY